MRWPVWKKGGIKRYGEWAVIHHVRAVSVVMPNVCLPDGTVKILAYLPTK